MSKDALLEVTGQKHRDKYHGLSLVHQKLMAGRTREVCLRDRAMKWLNNCPAEYESALNEIEEAWKLEGRYSPSTKGMNYNNSRSKVTGGHPDLNSAQQKILDEYIKFYFQMKRDHERAFNAFLLVFKDGKTFTDTDINVRARKGSTMGFCSLILKSYCKHKGWEVSENRTRKPDYKLRDGEKAKSPRKI